MFQRVWKKSLGTSLTQICVSRRETVNTENDLSASQLDTGSVHPIVKSVKIFGYTSLSASMRQLAIFSGKHIFLAFHDIVPRTSSKVLILIAVMAYLFPKTVAYYSSYSP